MQSTVDCMLSGPRVALGHSLPRRSLNVILLFTTACGLLHPGPPPHAELATKSYAGEPVFDLYARHFKTAAFLDQPISFAFAGKPIP